MAFFPGPLVIVGSGLAGYALVREFRKLDAQQQIVMICADSGCQYSKPLLSCAMSQGKSPEDLVTASAADMADRMGIIVRNNTRVDAIDPESHELLIGQERLRYGKLVLALGAETVKLPLHDDVKDHVFSVNSLTDYRALRHQLEQETNQPSKVAIVGGGLVGCELANDVAQSRLAVDLICASDQLLPGLIPPEMAELLKQKFEQSGIDCHMKRRVENLHQSSQGLLVELDSGQRLPAHTLISAIGLKPATVLAEVAGLAIGLNGIAVDRYLQTSDPDIYALGDCAEVDGVSLFYVKPLMACARALANTLTQKIERVTYGPMPVNIKTNVMPLLVVAPARNATEQGAGNWFVDKKPSGYRAEYRQSNGRLLGYALSDRRMAEQSELNSELPTFF